MGFHDFTVDAQRQVRISCLLTHRSLLQVYAENLRGVWGSFGALIVLATIVIDPFAQQVLSFYPCEIPDPTKNATTPRSSYFIDVTQHMAAGMRAPPLDMQTAVNAGLFGLEGDIVTPPDCSTGNCTFPPFFTIAYCSSCVDISDSVSEFRSAMIPFLHSKWNHWTGVIGLILLPIDIFRQPFL